LIYHTLAIQGRFIVLIPYMGTVYLEQIHPPIIFPLSLSFSPPFKQHLVSFIMQSLYVYLQCAFTLFTTLYPFLSPYFFPLILPKIVPLSSSSSSIVLGPGFTNEREHTIFDLLSLTYITQHDNLHSHLFRCKGSNFIFLYG
jgi:hypothetical protein